MAPKFEGSINIVIKIPKEKYEETLEFNREILMLEVTEELIEHPTVSRTNKVKFGSNIVWLDCVDNYTHSETWLELKTPNMDQAITYLKA